MRRIIRAIVPLAMIAGLGAAAWMWLVEPLLPPLADALPNQFKAADAVFKAQVAAKFALGSAVVDVIRELDAQGFARRLASNGIAVAELEPAGVVCRSVWQVSWRADERGRLVSIDAQHHGVCL